MQCIGGFLFLFVYDMRINLRGFDVSMSHQRLDGVYVNAIFQQQRSIAMPRMMQQNSQSKRLWIGKDKM